MDWIRSSYSTEFVFEDGGLPKGVYWFRCAKDALPFPGETLFTSLDQADFPENADIGEQRPPRGRWRDGMRPALYNGKGYFRGSLEQYAEGEQVGPLEPVECTTVTEPIPLATGPGPFQEPEDDEEALDNFIYPVLGIRWGYSNPAPGPLAIINAYFMYGFNAGSTVGGVGATWDEDKQAWTGYTVFQDEFFDPFLVTMTVTDYGSGVALCVYEVESTPNHSGGTMTAFVPWVEANFDTGYGFGDLQNPTSWFVLQGVQWVAFFPFP